MNIKDTLFTLKTGIKGTTLGEVTEHVIHYKDFYISILEGEDDEHTRIGWSHEPPDGFPLRDIVQVTTAASPDPETEVQAVKNANKEGEN